MRTWNGILATALAGAVIFTSCKKQDMGLNGALAATPGAQTTNGRPQVPNVGAFLSYRVATVPSAANAMLYFNQGGINTITIALDATEQRGDALQLVNFRKTIALPYHALYSPINLGNLNIPNGKYLAYKFSITMDVDNQNSALVLTGYYNNPSNSIKPPVQGAAARGTVNPEVVKVIVDQPIEFRGEYMPSLLINRQDYYTMTIYFDPAAAMSGITESTLNGATRNSNGQIIISSVQNPRIYNLIIQNLAKTMKIQFDVKDPLPSA